MYNTLAVMCMGSGLLIFFSGLLMPANLLKAIPLSLDFWTAAGLLKLSGGPSWNTILTAGLLIMIRKLANFTLNKRNYERIT